MSLNTAENVVDGRRGKRKYTHNDERGEAELLELWRMFGNVVFLAICRLACKMFSCIMRKKSSSDSGR